MSRQRTPGKKRADLLDNGLDMQRLGVPKHKRLQLLLEQKIMGGEYASGDKLPTEKELMHTYGYSYATVSRALKALAQCGFVRRRRGSGTFVNEAIHQRAPSTLSGPSARTIAHFHGGIPHGFHPYFSSLIEGFVASASEHAMFVKFTASEGGVLGVDAEFLQRHGIVGFSVSQTRKSELQAALAHGFPVVTLSRAWKSVCVDQVTRNGNLGHLLAFEHLRDRGHERLAVVHTGTMPDVSEILAEVFDCLPGQRAAAAIDGGGYDAACGERAAAAFLALAPRPTAAYVTDDFLLLHFLRALEARGIRTPQDVAVLGQGTPSSHLMLGRPVSFIETDPGEIAKAAVDLLVEQIETKRKPGRILHISPRLVVRESTGG